MAHRRPSPQDIVLILLFAGMAAVSPTHDFWEVAMIASLAALQIAESKLALLESTQGRVMWIMLKLTLAYLLIGYTGGLASSYYLMLLLPIVSAASYLGVWATLAFSLLACATYLSFILFVDWNQFHIDPDQTRILIHRLLFLAVAGNLVNAFAQALRVQAEQLAAANVNLSEAEAAVRRTERLAALGQLSAGLAHELRNPLGTIKASAEMLSRHVSEGDEITREMAGFISSEVDRTNSLVTRFLDFARPLHPRLAPTMISTVIERAIQMSARDAENGRVVVSRDLTSFPPVPLDAELMERVFYNLLLNAIQASPSGETVTVKARLLDRILEVCVIDHGSGIDPARIETIFNPFVTTKPEGVGLGLAIVSKIVDGHGGKMSVESEPGKGSSFRVSLPLL